MEEYIVAERCGGNNCDDEYMYGCMDGCGTKTSWSVV